MQDTGEPRPRAQIIQFRPRKPRSSSETVNHPTPAVIGKAWYHDAAIEEELKK